MKTDLALDTNAVSVAITAAGLTMLATVLYMMLAHGDWRLTLAGLGPLFFIPVVVRYLGPKIRTQSQRCQEALGSMAQTVEEVIGQDPVDGEYGRFEYLNWGAKFAADSLMLEEDVVARAGATT